jgi:hypothetical protein
MYDSLDTMWLMGLEDMFYDTVEDVAGQTFSMAPVCFLRVISSFLIGVRGRGNTPISSKSLSDTWAAYCLHTRYPRTPGS